MKLKINSFLMKYTRTNKQLEKLNDKMLALFIENI